MEHLTFQIKSMSLDLAFFLLGSVSALSMTAVTTNGAYLEEIKGAIQARCHCDATHLLTVFIHEKTADRETVWFGEVEVFELTGCRESKRCYGWQSFENGLRIVTILHSRIVESPHRAVQAAIFTGVQPPMLAVTDEAMDFTERMEKARKALYEAQIKAEDLEGIIKTVGETGA